MEKATIRLHYMDTLRAAMMILGVFYHAAAIYGGNWWYVSSGDMNLFLRAGTEILHTFRMPVFFIVSGFFTALLLTKNFHEKFLLLRLKRLIIPMLFCGFTVNFFMNGLATNREIPNNFNDYVWHGYWLGHLWFLGSLIIYTTLTFYLKKILDKYQPKNNVDYFLALLIFLFFYTLFIYLIDLPQNLHSIRYFFISVGVTIQYLPLFLIGYFLFNSKVFMESFLNYKFNLIALSIFAILFFSLKNTWVEKNVAVWMAIKYICFYAASGIVVHTFSIFLNKENKIIHSISKASYTIYLLHQPLLVALFHVMPEKLNAIISFLLISFTTLFLSYFFHTLLVSRIPILELLFNGHSTKVKN